MKNKKNYAILIASTSLAAILLVSLPQVYAADNTPVNTIITENKNTLYIESNIQKGFPVPSNALKTESGSYNADLLVERYELEGLKFENSIPEEYVNEIVKQGWKEIKEEQMGGMRVFSKDGEKVNIVTQNGFFQICKEIK
ncbi:hypothetical protein PUW24_20510 [Paenibacillus urinalis]|uniref:Uncharacterized protein n=1 Tax=Paenibacillus urinalis TaxID=521520 RepID=A0AAX3MT58_9BACL|nr:hypothetical protein [Paenibacillus urinalis]WDH80487.1 hypothetical protein PUW23_13005 [Paenibacillus urinalis]WDH96528.1 hypothetical protein PUW24_20510 [Paenibacillus urinalis]WDI00174.1 hypothetical protein PUW25_12675 [Paenibacillus urinalis]